MVEFSSWLDEVCEAAKISKKNLVHFGRWFVNECGDMIAYTGVEGRLSYVIYHYELTRYSDIYIDAIYEWVKHLEEDWMDSVEDENLFSQAFNLAWSRSRVTDQDDDGFLVDYCEFEETAFGRGVPCAIDYYVPGYDTKRETLKENLKQSEDVRIILEFSEEKQDCHFNKASEEGFPLEGYREEYEAVAETTWRTAEPFVRLLRARMNNGAIFMHDQVVAEWNYYVFLLLQINNDIENFGMLKKPTLKDIVRIEKRINICVGEYGENEMMKLRTIGVPKIRE